jgi:RHS repeat-associated protein
MIKMMKWCQKHKVPRLLKAIAASLLLLGSQLLATGVAEAAVSDSEYTVFYHNDLLGSPKAVTDMKGRVLWFENSRPYGNSTGRRASDGRSFSDNALEAADTRIGYTGHTQDTATGLVYMKARYYDPVIGRFYSNDPVGVSTMKPETFNRYTYANGNPYKYSDPDGKDVLEAYRNPGTALSTAAMIMSFAVADSVTPDPSDVVAGPKALGYSVLIGTATVTGYGLHKLSQMFNEKSDTDVSQDTSNNAKKNEKRKADEKRRNRQLGDSMTSEDDSEDQFREIESEQSRRRSAGDNTSIQSIEKSRKRADHELNRYDWENDSMND